jgi:AcrR family transcriptional regulator
MTSVDLKHQQRLNTRTRILDAARVLVIESGYAMLTMRRLAQVVDYSPAALYMHFASREEIALCLRDEARAELVRVLQQAGAPSAASAPLPALASSPAPRHSARTVRAALAARGALPATPLQRVAQAWLQYAQAHPHRYRLALLEPLGAAQDLVGEGLPLGLAAPVEAALQALPALASQTARRRSSTYRRTLRAHAEMLMATLHGLASVALVQPHLLSEPPESLLQRVLPTFERCLQAALLNATSD